MKLNYVVNNRLLPFDADVTQLDKTNPFYGKRGVVCDFSDPDPSGTDCVVCYLFDSIEEAFNGENNSIDNYDHDDEVSLIASQVKKAHPDKYLYLVPEEKCYLSPESKECALLLMEEQMKDMASIENHRKSMGDRNEWLNFSHSPYMYEKMGRVTMNCRKLLF